MEQWWLQFPIVWGSVHLSNFARACPQTKENWDSGCRSRSVLPNLNLFLQCILQFRTQYAGRSFIWSRPKRKAGHVGLISLEQSKQKTRIKLHENHPITDRRKGNGLERLI